MCYQDRLLADASTFSVQYGDIKNQSFICAGWQGKEQAARTCLTRKDRTKNAIFLLGESHARALKDGLIAASQREVLLVMWCGSSRGKLDPVQAILQDELRNGDIIWWVNNIGGSKGGRTAMHPSEQAAYRTNVDNFFNIARKKGAKLVRVEDWPTLGSPGGGGRQEAAMCHWRQRLGAPTACSVKISDIRARRAEAISVVNVMKGKPGVHVFEAWKYFCVHGLCDCNTPTRRASAYFDYGHLNPYGGRYLSLFLCKLMKQKGLQ